MSKALVIKGANFSANKLATIVISDPVPCTGIALNKSAETLMSIGATSTLIATPQPADTTDIVSWASSNTDVVAVNNGVITSVGVGTATITATCGGRSASCEVASRAFMDTENVLKRVGYYLSGNSASSGGNGLPDWRNADARSGGLCSNTGSLYFYGLASTGVYPYVMPKNTAKVKMTIPTTSLIDTPDAIEWFNHETAASDFPNVVMLIRKQSWPSGDNGVYVVDVPTVTGYPVIDALAIGIRSPSDSTLTEEMLAEITVEFLAS